MKRKISIEWSVEDVKCMRPQLTGAQCSEVLDFVEATFDANVGVNWGVLESCADELFPMDETTEDEVNNFPGEDFIGEDFAAIQAAWDEFLSAFRGDPRADHYERVARETDRRRTEK
jgi:hypothetical protein